MILISYEAYSNLEISGSRCFKTRVKYVGELGKLLFGLANFKKLVFFRGKGYVVFGAKVSHSLKFDTTRCVIISNKIWRDWKPKLANIFIRSFKSTNRRYHLNECFAFSLRLRCSWKVFWKALNCLEPWMQLIHFVLFAVRLSSSWVWNAGKILPSFCFYWIRLVWNYTNFIWQILTILGLVTMSRPARTLALNLNLSLEWSLGYWCGVHDGGSSCFLQVKVYTRR